MSENTLKAKILQLAGPAVGAQNLEIWGLEVIEAGRMLVRLYVDMPGRAEEAAPAETEDGDIPENISATVDQCESISRQLALALDAEEVIDRPYTLEVSTPGLDRLFFSADQMKDYTGEIIDARYPEAITPGDPVKPHRVWRGTLDTATGRLMEGSVVLDNRDYADRSMISDIRMNPWDEKWASIAVEVVTDLCDFEESGITEIWNWGETQMDGLWGVEVRIVAADGGVYRAEISYTLEKVMTLRYNDAASIAAEDDYYANMMITEEVPVNE